MAPAKLTRVEVGVGPYPAQQNTPGTTAMDRRITNCPDLTERDIALLDKVRKGLPITADVSRADVLLFCALSAQKALVVQHAIPNSISSLYRQGATGRIFTADEQPLILRALAEGRSSKRNKEVLSSGAPVVQQAYPIHNAALKVIGAILIETNMIEHERHRRRDASFRRAVGWLQEMATRGEIENTESLSGFGSLDGIYLVDENFCITYMSGIATNLFRTVGLISDVRGQHISVLEDEDAALVEQAVQAHHCLEERHESEDGRVWVRSVIPLRAPPASWQQFRRRLPVPWLRDKVRDSSRQMDGALVLVHNATEAVQKQRELNVKSALIQEVHHRVKNNLQTIAAIMRIQARRSDNEEARQHLTDAVNRVLSMSVIHEYLSQDEHSQINIKDMCQRIAGQTQQVAVNPGQQIDIRVSGPNIRLPAGQATAAALVINELLLNALEHGLQDRQEGIIEIVLADLGDAVQVTLQDDGNGLPPDFILGQSRSLGLQITQTLVGDDLKGELKMESLAGGDSEGDESGCQRHGPGTRAIVTFPKRELSDD